MVTVGDMLELECLADAEVLVDVAGARGRSVVEVAALALAHADALAQVQWRRSAHGAIAASLLETLAADPGAAAGTLVINATAAVPGAAGTLTAVAVPEGQDPAAVAAYLAEELSLGDAEEAIASMRALLSDPSQLAPEDYDALFQSVVGMQGDLNHRRQAHKPLPPA